MLLWLQLDDARVETQFLGPLTCQGRYDTYQTRRAVVAGMSGTIPSVATKAWRSI